MRKFIWLLSALWIVLPFDGAAQVANNTRASLLLADEVARPGTEVLAAVRLQMAPGWHTYWRNPGGPGLPTTVEWTLPAGVVAGEIQWPPPEAYVSDDITSYVYHREVLLLVPLKLAVDLKPGQVTLRAKVDWLECKEACVPGSAKVEGRLAIGSEVKASPEASLIADWRKRLPRSGTVLSARAFWTAPPVGEKAEFVLTGTGTNGFLPTDFYAYPAEGFEVNPGVKVLPAVTNQFRLVKTLQPLEKVFPRRIAGILVQAAPAGGVPTAYEVEVPIAASESSDAANTAATTQPDKPSEASGPPPSLLYMLVLAFVGGLILNIMPCVLPVIALKILGFVQQSKEAPQRVRWLGVMYAVGVVVSFLVLAGVVVAVQAAGGGASWGMQMQNPYFRLALLVVVLLVSLNLFGVFEVVLGGGAMGTAANLASKGGAMGAFFNGVLTVALATPCTAPFLAVALGFAFTQSSFVVMLIFVSTGLGLASPYLLLSWNPAWLRFLPKPGTWMLHFKVAMGFPMLATAIWLFDLAAPACGDEGVLWLGLFLSVIALTAWIWGEFVQRGAMRRGVAASVCVALLAFAWFYLLEGQLRWRDTHVVSAAPTGVIRDHPDGIEWHAWSPEAVVKARAEGKPVLVDFTAKWCFTCRANKKFALDVPSVRAKLATIGAIAFRADYTDRNPRITEELKRHGRAAVPLVVVFPKGAGRAPIVLPTTLTPGIVLEALDAAAK